MTTADSKAVYSAADYKGLSDTERRIFKSVVDDMDTRGLFRRADVPIIASYARNVVLARQAAKDVEKYGILLKEEDKYHGVKIKENPAVQVLQRAQKSAAELAIQLGLTPVGRKRTRTEEKPAMSDLDKWEQEYGEQ